MRIISVSIIPALTLGLAACSGGNPEADDPDINSETASQETIDVSDQPGPQIGDRAPIDFTLTNSEGDAVPLTEFGGEKGSILVFTRSVDWCPYCQSQLKSLNDLAPEIAEMGYALAGVSYDPVSSLSEFRTNQDISYNLLSDEGSKLIDAFAIRDPQYTEGRAVGVPYASIFVLDKDGVVKAKSVSSDYAVRPTNAEVKTLVESIG